MIHPESYIYAKLEAKPGGNNVESTGKARKSASRLHKPFSPFQQSLADQIGYKGPLDQNGHEDMSTMDVMGQGH